jgi:hypothetical protein
LKIYINDNLLTLRDGTVVTKTLKTFDVVSPTSRYVTYTNSIQVPATDSNKMAFGLLNNNHESIKPYRKYICKLVEGTREDLGLAVLDSSAGDIEFSMYFGSANFFEQLSNKLISDFDFSESVTWDDDTIESKRNTTSGIVAPFIQYGQIDETQSEFDVVGGAYLPSIYYKTILEGMINQSGYTPQGSIFNDDIYKRLAIAYSRDSLSRSEGYINARQFLSQITETQLIQEADLVSGIKVIRFSEVFDGYKNYFNNATSWYNVPSTEQFKADFFVTLTFQLISGAYLIRLRRQTGGSSEGVFYKSSALFSTPGIYSVTIQWSRNIGDDSNTDEYRVEAVRQAGSPGDIKVLSGSFYNKVYGDLVFSGTPSFEISDILPDIKAVDFVKHFAVQFGALFYEVGRELHCITLNEVLAAKHGVKDWTGKRDRDVEPVTGFLPDSFGQINTLSYPSNDDLYPKGQGDADFIIDNQNISERMPFYDSIFNGSLERQIVNTAPESVIAVHIPIWVDSLPTDYTTPFGNSPGLRLVYLRDSTGSDPSVKYGAANLPTSTYKVAMFTPIHMGTFVTGYLSKFIAALQMYKVVEHSYFLDEFDVEEGILFSLIHDSGSTYIIDEIKDFKRSESTRVRLLKVR